MLVKVFENLFDNVIRHGGNVTQISLTAKERGDSLIMELEDNGTGIPSNEKEMIFEPGHIKKHRLWSFSGP